MTEAGSIYALDPTEIRTQQKLDHRLPEGFADFRALEEELAVQQNTGRLIVVDTPTIRSNMDLIKNPDVDIQRFRELANTIITQLAQVATKLPVSNRKIALSVRAGLAFYNHAMRFMPEAEIGFSTQTRDEETAECISNGGKLGSFVGKHAIIFDPMLATGGSLTNLIDEVVDKGATGVTTVSAFTTPQGLVAVSQHPNVNTMITTPLEAGLNENAYIVGAHQPHSMLGDFGDRYFGSVGQ